MQSVKDRDFRRFNKDFLDIFNSLGKIYHSRNHQGIRKPTAVEYDINTDKFCEFIPQLSVQNVNFFVKMFGAEGLEAENHNLLVIFRNYHRSKYR